MNPWNQEGYDIKFDWSPKGVRNAAQREEIIVIVDILSFSSTVVTATHFGASIYPLPFDGSPNSLLGKIEGEEIVGRREAKDGMPSLSPVSWGEKSRGKSYFLRSLNGAVCALETDKAEAVLIGCFLNATETALYAAALSKQSKKPICVVACGERWADSETKEDTLRPCIEDYLGAGRILGALDGHPSPEALVCGASYLAVKDKVEGLIWNCTSSRELRERGFSADVEHCLTMDAYTNVPVMSMGTFRSIQS